MNIANHMQRAGRSRGERASIALGGAIRFRYAETARRVAHLAGAMRGSLGLEIGNRVALALTNCPEYLELMYACWHAGLVAVPINAKLHPSEFAYILDNSGARACFVTSDLSAPIATAQVPHEGHEPGDGSGAAGDVLRIIETGGDDYDALLSVPPVPLEPRAPDDPAWLFYTSGTTGRPKGATISHRNLHAMCGCYYADVDPGGPWDAILHAAPMSHGSGIYGVAQVVQAACHVIPESASFTPAEVYSLLRHWPGLKFFAAPTMVKRLLDHDEDIDPSLLGTLIYGGGPMYVEDCIAAIDRFGPRLSQLYGQGESPMTITALNAGFHADRAHPRWRERLGSVGIAQSAVEVRVQDEDGRPLPTGELGEIAVRGDAVMLGYWRDPEATARSLRGGWLHTGDVGCFDDDGFLTLRDRTKDMIIAGGTNIYPREVEEVLLRHPDVAEVSVIGRQDREWGEVVVAYVVPAAGTAPDATALDRHCLDHLARFKRPRAYRLIDDLPKNNYGKVLKTALRERDRKTPR